MNELEILEGIEKKIDQYQISKDDQFAELQIKFLQVSEELKELKAKGGRIAPGFKTIFSTAEMISRAIEEKGSEISALTKSGKVNYSLTLKDAGVMTTSASLTGNVQAAYGTPEVRPRAQLHLRDLIRVIASDSGVWKYYRSNTPAGEGSFGFQTTHGELKNQLDYDLTEITVTCEYLAGFVIIAKQMLSDLKFMQTFISNELVEDYLRKEDNLFFGQIYSSATGVGGTSTVTAERIIETIANLSENHFAPNGVVVTNPVWAKILKTKPSDYSVPGGVVISPSGEVLIAGVPLYRTTETNLGANKMLIGDWTKAALIQQEGLNVAMSEHDDLNFRKNLITIRAEAKIACAVLNPAAFVYTSAGTT